MKSEQINKLWGQLNKTLLLKKATTQKNQHCWGSQVAEYYNSKNFSKKQYQLQQNGFYLQIEISQNFVSDKVHVVMVLNDYSNFNYEWKKWEISAENLSDLLKQMTQILNVLDRVLNAAQELGKHRMFAFVNLFYSYDKKGFTVGNQLTRCIQQFVKEKRDACVYPDGVEKKSARTINERKFTKWKHKTLRAPNFWMTAADVDYDYQLFTESNHYRKTYRNKRSNQRTRKHANIEVKAMLKHNLSEDNVSMMDVTIKQYF